MEKMKAIIKKQQELIEDLLRAVKPECFRVIAYCRDADNFLQIKISDFVDNNEEFAKMANILTIEEIQDIKREYRSRK